MRASSILFLIGALGLTGALSSACSGRDASIGGTTFPSLDAATGDDTGTGGDHDASLTDAGADTSPPPPPADAGHDAAVDAGPPPPALDVVIEPSDSGNALLAAIAAAQTSVHVTMYILTDSRFLSAIARAKMAGRDVKVILNQDFPSGGNVNQSTFDTLKGYGVPVVWAPSSFTLTHEKSVLIDGTQAWIMTMNMASSATTGNREYLLVDRQAADIAEAEAIFAADYAGTSITPSGPLLVAPDNASGQIVNLIKSAKKTLDLEGEELSDNLTVTSLVNAKNAGVTVRVVLADIPPSNAQQNAVATLKGAGIPVVKLTTPYVHAKAIVADAARTYVGSANFTYASLQNNRELGLVTADATIAAKVGPQIAADFAAGTSL